MAISDFLLGKDAPLKNKLWIDIIVSVVDVGLKAMGIYFIYRWIVGVETGDEKTREILLGKRLHAWTKDVPIFVLVLASIYLAWTIITLLHKAAASRNSLEKRYVRQTGDFAFVR